MVPSLLLSLLFLVFVATRTDGALTVCADDNCAQSCTTFSQPPGTCVAASKFSFRYICDGDKPVIYESFGLPHCEDLRANITLAPPGECKSLGDTGSYLATCDATPSDIGCIVTTPNGAINLGVIPQSTLYLRTPMPAGAAPAARVWLFSLCAVSDAVPPTYHRRREKNSGFVQQYDMTSFVAAWPLNQTAAWTWNETQQVVQASFAASVPEIPAVALSISCAPATGLGLIPAGEVHIRSGASGGGAEHTYAINLGSSAICAALRGGEPSVKLQ